MDFNDEKDIDIYNKISKIVNNYDKKILTQLENKIFSDKYTEKEKTLIEYKRVMNNYNNNKLKYYEDINDINKINYLLKIVSFDDTVIENINKKILYLQLKNNMDIRLFNTLPKLKDDLDYEKFVFENEKVKRR